MIWAFFELLGLHQDQHRPSDQSAAPKDCDSEGRIKRSAREHDMLSDTVRSIRTACMELADTAAQHLKASSIQRVGSEINWSASNKKATPRGGFLISSCCSLPSKKCHQSLEVIRANVLPGIDLFSQGATPQISSALQRFTTEFEMDRCGSTAPWTPG